jgi:hypothetical protein
VSTRSRLAAAIREANRLLVDLAFDPKGPEPAEIEATCVDFVETEFAKVLSPEALAIFRDETHGQVGDIVAHLTRSVEHHESEPTKGPGLR